LKAEEGEITYLPAEILQEFAAQAFVALGTPLADAEICAEVLIAADLRGIESHGIGRLRTYCERIQAGVQTVKTEVEIVKETETTALVDGHHGMGAVIAFRSMRLAWKRRDGLVLAQLPCATAPTLALPATAR
jgi:LDH2 family malate/lactate/ureidoglycolate dehydrogenase